MKPEHERLNSLLVDTVTSLCKNGLTFIHNLRVQGLLAITTDDDSIFVVHINETFEPELEVQISSRTASSQNFGQISTIGKSGRSGFSSPSGSLTRKRRRQSPQAPSFPSVSCSEDSRTHDVLLINSTTNESVPDRVKPEIISEARKPDVKVEDNLNCELYEPNDVMFIKSDDETDNDEKVVDDTRVKVERRKVNIVTRPQNKTVNLNHSVVAERRANYNRFHSHKSVCGTVRSPRTGQIKSSYSANGSSSHSYGVEAVDTDLSDDLVGEAGDGKNVNSSSEQPNWDQSGLDEVEASEYYNNSAMASTSWNLNEDASENRGGVTGEEVVCQYEGCGKQFNYKRNLDRHQRIAHGGIYGMTGQMCFFCTVPSCGRIFYKNYNLHKHQREAHGMTVPG